MAQLSETVHRAESAHLLGSLLSSARRRDRAQLRSQVALAQQLRGNTNQVAYSSATEIFRKAYEVDRPTFYQNYKGAMGSAERASDSIMKAAIDAGAKDGPIIAYVMDDFSSSVSAYMMASFGHAPDLARRARRRDELLNLESNTAVQARTLLQRLDVLRAESERGTDTWLERVSFDAESSVVGPLLFAPARAFAWVGDQVSSIWGSGRKSH